MNLVFLDMDGVVVTARSHAALDKGGLWSACDPIAIGYLNKMVERYDVCFVLSSTWRYAIGYQKTIDHLMSAGFKGVFIGETPQIPFKSRGVEINAYLAAHVAAGKSLSSYLILDDNDDMLIEQKKNFIQTHFMDGITSNTMREIEEFYKREVPSEEPNITLLT